MDLPMHKTWVKKLAYFVQYHKLVVKGLSTTQIKPLFPEIF